MTYRRTETRVCPGCKTEGELFWSESDSPFGAAWEHLKGDNCWDIDTKEDTPSWKGTVHCAECGALVLEYK